MMNVTDSLAATLLTLVLASGQFLQERLPFRMPDWRLHDGASFAGEMRDFDWNSKSVVLDGAGSGSQVRVPAEKLVFWSKVRMLCSVPFHDRLANQLPQLQGTPGYRAGLEKLQRMGLTFGAMYVFLFCTFNWLLAGWLLRSGSILRWLESGLAFVVLAALCAWLVMLGIRQFGPGQVLEYVALALALHTVLYASVVWAIYSSGPVRSLLWYALCWILALSLPVTLGGTLLVAQVQGSTGALDMASWDRYLTEVWLRPMGLL